MKMCDRGKRKWGRGMIGDKKKKLGDCYSGIQQWVKDEVLFLIYAGNIKLGLYMYSQD